MNAARGVFEGILGSGADWVSTAIREGRSEDHLLDYKTVETRGKHTGLVRRDRENFSIACSAFGNTAGGVVVWGVDCRHQEEDGADVPTGIVPVENAERFKAWLDAESHRVAKPPLEQLESAVILSGGQSIDGLVVTYIPESALKPVQAIDDRFYIRAGSSSPRAPYPVIAGMFGSGPSPILQVSSKCEELVWDGEGFRATLSFFLKNRGPVLAKEFFLTASIGIPQECGRAVDLRSSEIPGVVHYDPTPREGGGTTMCAVAATTNRGLPAGGSARAIRMQIKIVERPSLAIVVEVVGGAEGAPPSVLRFDLAGRQFHDLWEAHKSTNVEWARRERVGFAKFLDQAAG